MTSFLYEKPENYEKYSFISDGSKEEMNSIHKKPLSMTQELYML